jgi:hypothetical protein
MDIDKLTKLARERVMNAKNPEELCNIFQLTPKQFKEIEANPTYQRILEHYNIEWNSVLNTPDRVKFRSAAWVEDNLDIIGTRMVDATTPLNATVEAGKFLAKLAGIGEKREEGTNNERFVINIVMDDRKICIDKPIATTPKELALEAITDQNNAND